MFTNTLKNNDAFYFNKVLDKCNNVTIRKRLEAVHTVKTNDTLNRALDIHQIFLPLINCLII